MADYRINHTKELVQEGDVVQVRVIRIDAQHRRIGLSLRQASDDNYVDWASDADVADLLDETPEEAIAEQA